MRLSSSSSEMASARISGSVSSRICLAMTGALSRRHARLQFFEPVEDDVIVCQRRRLFQQEPEMLAVGHHVIERVLRIEPEIFERWRREQHTIPLDGIALPVQRDSREVVAV